MPILAEFHFGLLSISVFIISLKQWTVLTLLSAGKWTLQWLNLCLRLFFVFISVSVLTKFKQFLQRINYAK